jgi:uncharacterized protein YjbI with pentapeptide repeats
VKGSWQELADLPFARALERHEASLASAESYDGAHFDQAELDGADASGSSFLECAFTGVTLQDSRLDRAQFSDVWLHNSRLLGVSLTRTGWRDVTLTGVVMAGIEVFSSLLRRVTFDRCKMEGVNFRDCDLTDVTFNGCMLREVDFGGARITRTSFPGSRLTSTTLTQVTLDRVDLRGAELGLTVDPTSLRGAIVTTAQLIDMAPVLAEGIGIVVDDQ